MTRILYTNKLDGELKALRERSDSEATALKAREHECVETRFELDQAENGLRELFSVLAERRGELAKALDLLSLPSDATVDEIDEIVVVEKLGGGRSAVHTEIGGNHA